MVRPLVEGLAPSLHDRNKALDTDRQQPRPIGGVARDQLTEMLGAADRLHPAALCCLDELSVVVLGQAVAGLGELLPERLDRLQPASPAGLEGHPRAALTEHLVIDLDTADRRLRHGSPPWSVIGNCVILPDIDDRGRADGGMIGEELIFVATCDIAGLARGKGFPTRELPLRLVKGVGWTGSNLMMSPFGPIWDTPFGTAGDFMIVPDPAAEVRVDFADGSAIEHFFLGDIRNTDSSAWECCPRDFLRRAVRQLEEAASLRLIDAFEQEFH